jgi:uncharacterized protein (DUF305 family)
MRARPILLAAVVVAAVLASGCSNDEDPSIAVESESTTSTTAAPDADAAAHNDADVTFVQMMIPHHEQAVEMAVMASERAGSPEVLELAARIEQAQQPEIDLMRGWLAEWGEEEGGADMDMGDMDMQDRMAELEAAGETEFDRRFLELMIEHHGGALEMAEQEVAEGSFEPAIELATQIVEAQQAEIDEMQSLLDGSQG